MYYISTRSDGKGVSISEAILQGPAEDGGLFVPETIPSIEFSKKMLQMNYKQIAESVLTPFLSDFNAEEVSFCVNSAYSSGFDNALIAPLVSVNNYNFLELFHGRTIAFKDMALSILPYLMQTASKKLNINKKIVILTATSGDTGKAALSAFAELDRFGCIVFYPHGGVSKTQFLQMVTQAGKNTAVFAVRGNFDTTQKGVKKIFADNNFRTNLEKNNILLSSANSINIGRLLPQIAYYYYAYAQMVNNGKIDFGENINFAVPTGNFGNILAGWYAKKAGLPVNKLICASNSNKVLSDFFHNGEYDINREFNLTISPSMDILVSSNLERLLFNISNPKTVRDTMSALSQSGKYSFNYRQDDIIGGFANEDETRAAILEVYKKGYTIDPHTAVAFAVLRKTPNVDPTKTVILSTASPFKFAESVLDALEKNVSVNPHDNVVDLSTVAKIKIPNAAKDIFSLPILHNSVIEENSMQAAALDFILCNI